MLLTLLIIIYVLSSSLSDPHAQSQNEYDVIIMGAGSSGIAAAKTLYEANITNILIIEAMDYIGGRTKVVNISNYMLNIGASWISGACINHTYCSQYNEINPMLTAAYKYNISFITSDWNNGVILDIGGQQHNVTDSDNIYNKFYNAQDCINNIMQNTTRSNPDDMSMFAAWHICGWRTPHNTIEKTIMRSGEQNAKWRTAFADNKYVNTYTAYGPDDLFITDSRGYSGIIEALANDIDNINIILNSAITTIEYDENRVCVTLENTTQYCAKYAIVTFSLGVLQSDIVQFVPKLPSWKIDSLLAFDIIEYVSVFIKWPYRFWNDSVANDAEIILLNDERYDFFTWIYNLDHSNLFNGSLIWRFGISLDLAEMVQLQNINDTIRMIIELKLSHYFDNIPNPDDIFVTSWYSNKYFQGSWSNWPVGFKYDSKQAMGWPLLQRLFFSGEAMTDFDYGYVHTAWLSGNHTANKILACMGYDLSLTKGFHCPSQYIPPPSDHCKSMDKSVFKDLVWLWIVLAVIFGIILGCLCVKYNFKRNSNYGSVDNMNVPMVTQNAT